MGDILFLAHRMPFPPDRGDKIRSHHVLKALSRLAPVHVATFADDDADWAFEADLAGLSASHCLLPRRKSVPRSALEAVLTGIPVSLAAFHDGRLQAFVRDVLARHDVAAIYIFSGQMAQYVPDEFRGRVVADLVDVDSAKFEAYAGEHRGLRKWMEQREARLLAAEEARIAERADVTLLISEAEAELLRSRLAHSGERVAFMANGIDANHFDPQCVSAEPAMLEAGYPRIVFTGQMDYAPNIRAVERAVRDVLPLVRAVLPEASFHIVGRNPTREVLALNAFEGVTVWGRVPDVRPFLASADLALVPLAIARGVQNKVLEAMAMALPVVLTPGAATGIRAPDGEAFLVRESNADMAQAIVDLARDRETSGAIGKAARRWICETASWEAALAGLARFCDMAPTRGVCDVA